MKKIGIHRLYIHLKSGKMVEMFVRDYTIATDTSRVSWTSISDAEAKAIMKSLSRPHDFEPHIKLVAVNVDQIELIVSKHYDFTINEKDQDE